MFNALLPVIHILIYTIFVGTAADFAEEHPFYAIACLAFMIPAEKFIRKMFGFDKASTVSPMGAAAGGAMIMNAVNKIGNMGPKTDAKQENKPVRTTGTGGTIWKGPSGNSGGGNSGGGNSGGGNSGGGNSGGGNSGGGNPGGVNPGGVNPGGVNPGGVNPGGGNSGGGNSGGGNSGGGNVGPFSGKKIKMNTPPPAPKGIRSALKEARRDRITVPKLKKFGKNVGKRAIRGVAKGFGGAALGTIGVAAGVATGDFQNALTYGIAGAAAGGKLTGKVADRGINEAIRTGSAAKKGYYGGTEYKTRKTIDELMNDVDFTSACNAAGISKTKDKQLLARQFMQNGVTDKEDIVKAVMARKAYEENHGIKRDKVNGRTVIKDKNGRDITSTYKLDNERLIDMAVRHKSIGDAVWADEDSRTKILDRMYNNGQNGLSKDDVQMFEEVISGIKG